MVKIVTMAIKDTGIIIRTVAEGKSEEHIVISCKEDFLKSISKINNAIVIDCLPNNRKANWIRKFFQKKKSLLVVVILDLIPLHKLNIKLILKKVFSLILKPRKFISKI